MEEEEHARCLRKEKSSGMARVERWRKKKKERRKNESNAQEKIATRQKNKEIESLRLEF